MNYFEFKKKYENIIFDFDLTESEIKIGYEIYLEDPSQFNENMLIP